MLDVISPYSTRPDLGQSDVCSAASSAQKLNRKKKLVGQWVMVKGQLICQWTLK
jgi:hypothetical protein